MPIYVFCKKDKPEETWEEMMMIAEMEQYLKDNPDTRQELQVIGTVADSFYVGQGPKVDRAFKDRLLEIKSKHRGAKMNIPS